MYKDKELIDYVPNYQDMSQIKVIDVLVKMLQKRDRQIFGLETSLRHKKEETAKHYENLYWCDK